MTGRRPGGRIRVAVIDHDPAFVHGLELLLPEATNGRAAVVASTGDAASAAGLVRRAAPGVVLVDLHLPPPGGLRAVGEVCRAGGRVLAVSGDAQPSAVLDALRAGATGFLPRTGEPALLLAPLLAAVDGWAVLPPAVLADLVTDGGRRPAVHLGEDDENLLRLIAAGASTTEIALRLHLSDRTVKRQTAGLLRRLRVSSRTEAAALAGRAGLL